MRTKLQDRSGRRGHFRATFKRFGSRHMYKGPDKATALFVEIRDESGNIVADHLWFMVGDQLGGLELEPGDEIFFIARVKKYWKRNKEAAYDPDEPERVQDYCLANPSKVQKLGAQITRPLPLFDEAQAARSTSVLHREAQA